MRAKRLTHGRVRVGLDLDAAAGAGGTRLPAATIALLRSLADQIDHLERQLRASDARAYDRVPLAQLVEQFHTIYRRVFTPDPAAGADPFAAAAAAFQTDLERARLEGQAPIPDDAREGA